MTLPRPIYWLVTKLVPIACVDVLPQRRVDGDWEFGLILRENENGGRAWNLVGGRILRNETVADAVSRHLVETLGTHVATTRTDFAEPDAVGEYLTRPDTRLSYDPRKHAIALTYLVEIRGDPQAMGEAFEFRWFRREELPTAAEVGFRQRPVINRLLKRGQSDRTVEQPSR